MDVIITQDGALMGKKLSRSAHDRADFPCRDHKNFPCHIARKKGDKGEMTELPIIRSQRDRMQRGVPEEGRRDHSQLELPSYPPGARRAGRSRRVPQGGNPDRRSHEDRYDLQRSPEKPDLVPAEPWTMILCLSHRRCGATAETLQQAILDAYRGRKQASRYGGARGVLPPSIVGSPTVTCVCGIV
jgi:hypothetical protein